MTSVEKELDAQTHRRTDAQAELGAEVREAVVRAFERGFGFRKADVLDGLPEA